MRKTIHDDTFEATKRPHSRSSLNGRNRRRTGERKRQPPSKTSPAAGRDPNRLDPLAAPSPAAPSRRNSRFVATRTSAFGLADPALDLAGGARRGRPTIPRPSRHACQIRRDQLQSGRDGAHPCTRCALIFVFACHFGNLGKFPASKTLRFPIRVVQREAAGNS